MTKKGMLALAILMTIMPWVPAGGEAWAETAQTYDGTSSEEQRKGLDYVNRIRKAYPEVPGMAVASASDAGI